MVFQPYSVAAMNQVTGAVELACDGIYGRRSSYTAYFLPGVQGLERKLEMVRLSDQTHFAVGQASRAGLPAIQPPKEHYYATLLDGRWLGL